MKGHSIKNKYKILDILTQNVSCETYLAQDKRWFARRRYVIKKIRPILGNPQVEKLRHMLSQEASILRRLSGDNPQIPRLYEYFMDGEDFYLIREWIDGLTLEQKVKQEGKLSAEQVEDILRNILSFLKYIHSYDIIYRQLKPNSIVLRQVQGSFGSYLPVPIYFGGVKELETAIQQDMRAKVSQPDYEYSLLPRLYPEAISDGLNSLSFKGLEPKTDDFLDSNHYNLPFTHHRQYIPPEQHQNKSVFASDLYSLGLTAIYLLTGKHPAEFSLSPHTNRLLWHEEALSLKTNLVRVIERATCPQVNQRYSSAEAMLGALDSQTVNLTLPETTPISQKNHTVADIKIIAFLMTAGIGVLGLTFALLNFDLPRSPQNKLEPQIPVEQAETEQPVTTFEADTLPTDLPASLATASSDRLPGMEQVPPFPLGMSQQSIINLLGEPTMNSRGYWQNSRALLYQDIVPQKIALGYLTDTETTNVRQAEIAFSNSVNLLVIKQEAKKLLQHSYSPEVDHYINQIYFRTSDQHYFSTKNIAGVVQRNPQEHIYIAIWEQGFHSP